MRTIQSEIQKHGLLSNQMNTKVAPKLKEKLSKRDLEELMGTRRQTYKRVRGAYRSK